MTQHTHEEYAKACLDLIEIKYTTSDFNKQELILITIAHTLIQLNENIENLVGATKGEK